MLNSSDYAKNYASTIGKSLARGDYNTEALIFKMATARFLMFLEKKKEENAFALVITLATMLKQLFSSGSANI